MVSEYVKGVSVPVSQYFSSTDFDCKCQRPECNKTLVDGILAQGVDFLRAIAGEFKIDSGFRCPDHNKEIGGLPDSQHLLGKAADCRSLIGLSGKEMAAKAELINQFFSGGIGTYNEFAHCDVRGKRARWDFTTIS